MSNTSDLKTVEKGEIITPFFIPNLAPNRLTHTRVILTLTLNKEPTHLKMTQENCPIFHNRRTSN